MPKWLTAHVSEVWPGLTDAQWREATRRVEQAERLISTRFPTIEDRVLDGALDPAVVGDVVEAMVTRALDKSRRGGMDKLAYPEISMEWADDGGAGTGSTLYLTTDELMLLSPPKNTGAFSIHRKPRPTW